MFGSRRGRPSLIGRAAHTAARTAVIAGTATAVSNKVSARQGAGAAAAPAPVVPAAPAGLDDDAMARLQKLAELQQAGILTEAEFAEQKARILG